MSTLAVFSLVLFCKDTVNNTTNNNFNNDGYTALQRELDWLIDNEFPLLPCK